MDSLCSSLYFYFYLGMKRSHHCNQLRKENAGSPATLIGWIDSLSAESSMGKGGVFDWLWTMMELAKSSMSPVSELFPKLKPESVIEVRGETRNRDEGSLGKSSERVWFSGSSTT
jgi:aspartyl-tRNA synthetase